MTFILVTTASDISQLLDLKNVKSHELNVLSSQ